MRTFASFNPEPAATAWLASASKGRPTRHIRINPSSCFDEMCMLPECDGCLTPFWTAHEVADRLGRSAGSRADQSVADCQRERGCTGGFRRNARAAGLERGNLGRRIDADQFPRLGARL